MFTIKLMNILVSHKLTSILKKTTTKTYNLQLKKRI